MNKFGVAGLKCFLIAAGMLVYTGVAWATTNSCPNTTSTSAVNGGGDLGTHTVTIAGPGGGTPANDLASLGAAGCTAVDFKFSNFSNSTFTGLGVNGAETASATYMAETPAGINNNPVTDPDTLLFSTVRGAADVNTKGDNNDGLNSWVVGRSQSVNDDITYNIGNSGNNPSALIYGILLTVYEPVVNPGATGSVTLDICEGTSPNTQILTAAACTAAGGTAFVTSTLTLPNGSESSLTLNVPLTAAPSALDITTIINLASVQGGPAFSGIDAFSEAVLGAPPIPEPPTFLLLGTALAAIGLFRFRARRKAETRVTE